MDTMHTTDIPTTGTTPRTVAEVLDAAADYLERHGWCRQDFYAPVVFTGTPRACALGAIRHVIYGQPIDDPHGVDSDESGPEEQLADRTVTYLAGRLADPTTPNWSSDSIVGDWNDSRRDPDTVTTELRAAASAYRSERAA